MSAEEHLRRLRADVDTLLEVQLQGWSDEAWEPLARALVQYGVGVIRGWMHTKQIFEEVARGGFGKVPRCPDSWLDDDTIEELTGETVAKALHYFKYEVLMANRWDASRGASLATFFIGQCKRQFANVYRSWFKDLDRSQPWGADSSLVDVAPSGVDVGHQAVTNVAAERMLDRLSSPMAQEVFRKKFIMEYTYAQIANTTPGVKDAKAAENIVAYEKRRLQKQ